MSRQAPPNHRPTQRIDCRRCIHYQVTWQQATPHSCRAMGFKSRSLPSLMVLRNSGSPCLYFQRKRLQPR